MQSWIIGKMILTTWRNRWWQATKRSPLVGLIPLVVVLGLAVSGWYVYDSTYQTFFGADGPDSLLAGLFLKRFGQVTFFLVAVAMVLFWQWGIRGNVQNRLLETLPVRRAAWIGGQLLPIALLMLGLVLTVFLPVLLVLLDSLPLSISQRIVAVLLYAGTLACAMALGMMWQQSIHLLAQFAARGRSTSVQRLFHGGFFLLSVMVAMAWGGWFIQQGWDIWSAPLPGALFAESVLRLAEGSAAWWVDTGMLTGWLAGLIVGVWLLFRLESDRRSDEGSAHVWWSSFSFPRVQWLAITVLEWRRWFRDAETHLYTSVSIFFLAFVGGWLRMADWQLYLPLYEMILFYGIPFLLCIYPMLARGRDVAWIESFRLLPLPTYSYIGGEMFAYLFLLPFLAWGMLVTLQALAGLAFPGPIETVTFLLYAVLLLSTAFVVGTALPSDESKFTGKWMVNLVFVSVSVPLFYGVSMLQARWPTPVFVVAILGYVLIAFLIAFALERGRERT